MPENNTLPPADDKNSPSKRRSPARQIILWLFILVVIPSVLFMMNRNEPQRVKELATSEFEELLTQKRIVNLSLTERTGSAIVDITGDYWTNPETIGQESSKGKFSSSVIYTDRIDKLIQDCCPDRKIVTKNHIISNILYSILPLLLLVVITYFLFSRQIRSAGGAALQFGKSRARRLNPHEENITLKDVAGCDEAKEEMREIVDYLKSPSKFSRLGGRIPRGVLMIGQPGTGKTLLAKAIAGEANVPFFTISGSDFVEMFVGVGASRVRDMFADAKKNAPCLIFIDEIDAVGRSRFSGIGGGHDEREQTLNAMLVEMDGFTDNSGVIVLAATNRPDVLDPALLRPGRFDRQVVLDLPDMEGRFQILNVHAKKVKISPDVDLHVIARGTAGFSGADLANLLNEAAILATRRNLDAIGLPELEESRDKVMWGKERRSRKLTDKTRRLTAYHEAGHALLNIHLKHTEPLHKVTIIPRGMAMGATMFLPAHDTYNITYNQAIDNMAMGMGGRAAEKIVFEDVSSGASMDLRQATEMARRMICEWGMDPNIGPVSFSQRQPNPFLAGPHNTGVDCSEETEREIDLAIRTLTENAYKTAMDILTEHRDQLELLATTLLKNESMSAEQIYELLQMPMPKDDEEEEKQVASATPQEPPKTEPQDAV